MTTTAPAWYRRMLPLPGSPAANPVPATDRDAALDRFAALTALDEGIPEATRTRLFEPDDEASATLVIWHGFTNAPIQFVAVAEHLRDAGYRVLLPRMPHHGLADVLTRELARLTVDELTEQVDACVDIAAGFGAPVWVVGLSAGAGLAAWAAATRPEVTRLVLAAPLVAPKGFPLPVLRAFVRFPGAVPRFYNWWDPRAKDKLGHSPYAYPGFPLPGLFPFLHLTEALLDGSVPAGHRLERVVLINNPCDVAIRRDAAGSFAPKVFAHQADEVRELVVDPALAWPHDFVDPWSPGGGTPEQVTAVLLAGLGAAEPTAGGLLTP